MKTRRDVSITSLECAGAFTLIELLVICVTLALLALIILGILPNVGRAARLKQCSNNLKHVGLAFKTWSLDSGDSYSTARPGIHGGSLEAVTSGETFLHFQVISNELGTPNVLVCPTDTRWPAQSFTNGFSNTNLSYFVGVDAADTNPNLLLSGDRNVTNGLAPVNKIMLLTTNPVAQWTRLMHDRCGNILLADGSVQQCDDKELAYAVAHSGAPTNRIQLP